MEQALLCCFSTVCGCVLMRNVRVHHDVCRLGVGGVQPNVQRLDSDLHRGRGIEEDPAGVVGVARCRILKDATWRKQLNVAVCRAKMINDEMA